MPEAPYTLPQAEEDIANLRGQVDRLQEIISVGAGPTPNTPSSGISIWNAGGFPNFISSDGLTQSLAGTQGASFPSTAVTAATLTTIASFTIPANDAVANAIYELEATGTFTWGSTQQTLQFAVAFGGNAYSTFTLTANAFQASQSGRWQVQGRLYCKQPGGAGVGAWQTGISGIFSCNGTAGLNGSFNTTGASVAAHSNDGSTVDAVDSTVAETFALQCAWGSTTGSPSITSRISIPKRLF